MEKKRSLLNTGLGETKKDKNIHLQQALQGQETEKDNEIYDLFELGRSVFV